MNTLKLTAFLAIAALIINIAPLMPAERARGSFRAARDCPAYKSKRKKSNPGNARLVPGRVYPVKEINKNPPDWYRIRIEGASPALRWVNKSCGKASISGAAGAGSKDVADSSSTSAAGSKDGRGCVQKPGYADSYMFAVSWQPAFCESHRRKKECKIKDPGAYQAKNFTLHGLWPNQKRCGKRYGFCGRVKKRRRFCDYPPVALDSRVTGELAVVMPGSMRGSCLDRHEWYKHGVCQSRFTANQYFDVAVKLTRELNRALSPFMERNIGRRASESDFIAAVDGAFGRGAHRRFRLGCRQGNLVDVYIKLDRNVVAGASLKRLIFQADSAFSSSCGGSFRVDPIDD